MTIMDLKQILRVLGTIWIALAKKFHRGSPSREHWLDHFLDGHECMEDPICQQAARWKHKDSLHPFCVYVSASGLRVQ